ncbi:MAG: hypothetical protein E7528_04395 [Ruminococcaceae bacterium]|nr:hypothetical protein [Oscillospiraceae bacterium]
MIAIGLIAIFLFVGLVFLQFPLSEYETTTLIFCMVAGLSAVVIVVSTIIIKKLNSIQKLLEENKNSEKNLPENKDGKAE